VVVPLSALALQTLERQAQVRTGTRSFPAATGPDFQKRACRGADAVGVDAGTPHSWRSVLCDACVDRMRVDRDLAEAALAHALGNVEATYRRETAVEARRAVMRYADWLTGELAKVIAFPARAL
jgi:integrase